MATAVQKVINTFRNPVQAFKSGLATPGGILNPQGNYSGLLGNYSNSSANLNTEAYRPPMPNTAVSTNVQSDAEFNKFLDQQRALGGSISSIQNQINGLSNPAPAAPPTLPAFDINDVFNRARSAATSAVSPYYETLLQQFKDTQAKKRTQAQQDVVTLQTNIAQDLKTSQAQNEQTRQRTGQDVATNEANIQAADQAFQQGNASAFTKALTALRGNQANSNTTFSGIGQQNVESALQGKSQQEAQATGQATNQVKAQELFKTRTFEDLAKSDELAQQSGERQTKAAQVNLDRLYGDMTDELLQQERSFEQAKQDAIGQNEQQQGRNIYTKFLSTLRTPQEVSYANQLYGGIF